MVPLTVKHSIPNTQTRTHIVANKLWGGKPKKCKHTSHTTTTPTPSYIHYLYRAINQGGIINQFRERACDVEGDIEIKSKMAQTSVSVLCGLPRLWICPSSRAGPSAFKTIIWTSTVFPFTFTDSRRPYTILRLFPYFPTTCVS